MSLVERALDKLRHGQPSNRLAEAPAGLSGTIGALLDTTDPSGSGRTVVIDRGALRAAGYLPEEGLDRRFADEYRQIKRPLLARAFSSDTSNAHSSARLIMMASALPGDGKTFSSINLALSLAREKDTSVVLVDADVAKPHISRIFGVDSEPGLLDALADPGLGIASLILPTDVKGLYILPAGKVRESATELLASARMKEVASQILAAYQRSVVLFDSPPLVVSSESRALAAAMGQVAVVVRAGRTPRRALLEALGYLPESKAAGLVLNQGRHSLLSGYYGQYGSYGEDGSAQP
ncbi:MAG: AAA family ATPase [Pseudomonadota bacterium]|nr:AAA family ATPase [Pseudomonadota bacterium]